MINPNLKKNSIFVYVPAVILVVMVCSVIISNGKYNKETKAKEKMISGLEEKLALMSDARVTLLQALKKSVRYKRVYKNYLEEEKTRRRAIEEQLSKVFSEMSGAKSQVKTLEEQNAANMYKISSLEQEKGVLSEQLAALKKMQTGLQEKIKRLLTKADVELGQVVVTPANLQGKILKANPSYNFVIVDLGKNDGVKPQTALAVYRDANQIGEIKIEKVYDELSVGKAAFRWTGNEMGVGDIVRGKN